VIDDFYSLVGSSNLDARSLRLNFELCVELFDPQLNSQLSEYFEAKIEAAQLVSMEQLNSVSLMKRIRNALAWLFSPYL
jgi:cardiolipin synthase